jgi:hypothetical protein
MGVNWLAGLHHPGRARSAAGHARLRKAETGSRGRRQLQRWAPDRRHHRPDPGKVDHTVQALVKEG